jgi:hypothetical protein
MAAGIGLTPEQRRLLLQALIQGGSQGMTDPAAALQGLLAAPGGASAAQAIVAGLRNRLLPAGPSSVGSPAGPAVRASRGLSGAEPTYAQDENPSGILGETKASEKKPEEKKPEDLAAKVKELADKTPEAPAPAGNGILTVPPVPDVPDAGAAVRSAVGGSLRAAARRGQGAMPSERAGPIAITETITKAALRHGVDPTGLIKTAGIESHFNPNAKNPRSSAGGLFQFVDSTAKQYGLSNKYDAAQSADAAARLWKDNKDSLTRSLGREPTNGELYLAHQQGPAGAAKIIKNPDASVASTVGKAAAHLNAGSGMTNRQFVNMWTRRMGGGSGTPETAAQQGALLEEARQPAPDVPLPPRRPGDIGDDSQPLTLNVTPSRAETRAPAVGAPDTTPAPGVSAPDTDLGPVTSADQASLGGDAGLPDIGGLLGGLDTGDAGADSGPSQLQEWDREDAKEPDKPILSEEDKQPGGILSGDSLLGDQAQERVDLSRMFSPEGMGGSGLLGRDQAPEITGFKAPVGLPNAGSVTAAHPFATGILSAPGTGLANITPPQLRSTAQPSVPLPPPRPPDLGAPQAAPLEPPVIQPRPALRKQDLPGFGTPDGQGRIFQPPNVGTLPRRQPDALPSIQPTPSDVPLSPRRPAGLLAPSPPAVDPDRMVRDPAPNLGTPPIGPGMGGPNPPWQDPPGPTQAGILGTAQTATPSPEDFFAKLTKNAGILSGALGQATSAMTPSRRLSGPSPSRPLGIQEPLLTGGLLSNARAGIDLNRFFGLLSGRVG